MLVQLALARLERASALAELVRLAVAWAAALPVLLRLGVVRAAVLLAVDFVVAFSQASSASSTCS